MTEKLEFYAALSERSCCKFDRDGAAVIKLETDAQQTEKEPGKLYKLSAPSDMKLQARHDFIRSRPEWERLLIRRFGRHLVKAAAKADTKPDVGSFMREFQRLNIGGGILRQGGNANSIETGGKRKWKDDRSAAGRAKK